MVPFAAATAALTFTDISGEKVLAVDAAENNGKTYFRATDDVTLKLTGAATDGEFPFMANIYVPDAATTVTVDISDVTGDCTGIRMTGGLRGAGTIAFGTGVKKLRFGAPPHGGMGIGLDRLVMQMLGCESLRDVVAYPKVQNASEPMTGCPATVDTIQLDELGIAVKTEE